VKQRKDLNKPTDTQQSHSYKQQQMDAVVIQASGRLVAGGDQQGGD
jgi:hypothetical protein